MTDEIEQLPDGLYLNLSQRDYFGQKGRKGSTDWMTLDKKGLGWWWVSEHNPRYRAPKQPERTYGSALHAIMLEGIDAYEQRFAVLPDKANFPGVVDSVREIEAVLERHRISLPRRPKDKAEWNAAMEAQLPGWPCWDNILAAFALDLRPGMELVTAEEDEMLRLMRNMALEDDRRDNAELRALFAEVAGQPPLAEVSVLYTDAWDIKRRARIDKMFPRFDMDVKSLGNWRGRPLPWEVGDLIARNRWFMQRADHRMAREVAYEFILEGKIYGATVDQMLWLQRWPGENPHWDYVWLAYQKPDSVQGRAPIIMPVWDDAYNPGGGVGPLLEAGHNRLVRAHRLYRDAVKEFGLEKPWGRVEPVHYTDETEPRVFVPSYVAIEEPQDEAAYSDG
jgi:hypothetical protein